MRKLFQIAESSMKINKGTALNSLAGMALFLSCATDQALILDQ